MNDNNIIWKHLKKYDKEGFQNDVLIDKLKKIKLKNDKSFENFTNSEKIETVHDKIPKKMKKKTKKREPVEGFGPRPMIARIPPYEADETDDYEGDDDGHFEKAYGGPDDKRTNVNMYDIRNTLIDMVDFIFNMFRYMIAFLAFLIVRTFSSSNNITFNKNKRKKNKDESEDEHNARAEEETKYMQERSEDKYFYIRTKNKDGYIDPFVFFKDIKYLTDGNVGSGGFINDVHYIINKLQLTLSLMFSFVFTYLIYFVTFYSEYNDNTLDGRGVLNIFEDKDGEYVPRKKYETNKTDEEIETNDYGDRINFEPFISYDKLVRMFCNVPSTDDNMSGGNNGEDIKDFSTQKMTQVSGYLMNIIYTIIYFMIIGPIKACDYIHWLLLVYIPNLFLGNVGILPLDDWWEKPPKIGFGFVQFISKNIYSNASLFLVLFYLIFEVVHKSGSAIKDTFKAGLMGEMPANIVGVYVMGISLFILFEFLYGAYTQLFSDTNPVSNMIGGNAAAAASIIDGLPAIPEFPAIPANPSMLNPNKDTCSSKHLDETVPKTPFWIPTTPDPVKALPFIIFWIAFVMVINIIILIIVVLCLVILSPLAVILYLFSIPFKVIFNTMGLEDDNIFVLMLKYIVPGTNPTNLQTRINTYCELKRNEMFELKYQDVIDRILTDN